MTEWAGRTMKERVVLFHRRFPNKRISLTALYRLYKANGVKRKAVKVNKTTPPPKVHNYEEQRAAVEKKVDEARAAGMPVVYLDELCFTKQNYPRQALSLRN